MPLRHRVDVAASRGFGRHARLVRRLARRSLAFLEEPPGELSVALVDDREMQALNAAWRGKDRPTDVLAFSQREGGPPAEVRDEAASGESELLGDVVISVPTAARQAAERGHSLERELAELLVHGILHLVGYDHERSRTEARRMSRRQREVLAALGTESGGGPPFSFLAGEEGSSG